MAPRHLHLEGSSADQVDWDLEWPGDEDFDAQALEDAMITARETAYRDLAELDAA